MQIQRRRHLRQLAGAAAAAASASQTTWSAVSGTRTAPFTGNPALQLRPQRTIVWQDFLGVNAQFNWFTPDLISQQIARLQTLGLNAVRVGLSWAQLEPQAGQFQLSEADTMMNALQASGLHSIVYLTGSAPDFSSAPAGDEYPDKYPPRDAQVYALRIAALAQRYPQVDVWQVWNEPNLPGFWAPVSDPQGYSNVLQASVSALRQVAPQKPIAMAGMAYYSQMVGVDGYMLQAMGQLGAYKLNLVTAYHPYTAVPEGSQAKARDFLTTAAALHAWLRANGANQIWATEWGWSSYAGAVVEQPIVGEAGQADYTLRRLALMAALDYDRVFLFTLSDLDARADVRDRSYGLLRENGEPKPVYLALQQMLNICGPSLTPATPPGVLGGAPAGLISIGWRRADGRRLCMLWADAPVTLTLPAEAKGTLYQPLAGTQGECVVSAKGLVVPVSTSLQLLLLSA